MKRIMGFFKGIGQLFANERRITVYKVWDICGTRKCPKDKNEEVLFSVKGRHPDEALCRAIRRKFGEVDAYTYQRIQ